MNKSTRIFIRGEKARIRRAVLGIKDQDSQIAEMYVKLAKKPEIKVVEVKKPVVKTSKPKTKKVHPVK